MKHFIICVFAALALLGCGGSDLPTAHIAPVRVEMRGDSITAAAMEESAPGTPLIAKYLPAASEPVNLGLGGQRAWDSVVGRYGSLPSVWRADTVYTFSWGANECLQGLEVEWFKAQLNHILWVSAGYKRVIEAPWRMQNNTSDCNARIDLFRKAAVDIAAQYNVPVVIEDAQDNIGEGVHLTQDHMNRRAKLLADAVLKL